MCNGVALGLYLTCLLDKTLPKCINISEAFRGFFEVISYLIRLGLR